MLSSRQINNIIKKMYPTSTLSRGARKHFRLAMSEEIEEYLDEHPDATYEAVLQHYENSEMLRPCRELPVYITKIIVCIGLLLAMVCAILFFISSGWTPPTYNI